ncbi:MAG TPA: ComEC/Rec2 family competence protein, partial [Gammaproteobacteria bacterium]|nr:ComEC/Rec2 family competence protein [Gammaproteobacteria bacterium]
MLIPTLTFLLGDLFIQTQADLPSLRTLTILSISALALCFFLYTYLPKYKHLTYLSYLPFIFTLGLIYTTWHVNTLLAWQLPKTLEGETISISGRIASLPNKNAEQTSFMFLLEQLQQKPITSHAPLIRLTWRHHPSPPPQLKVGDQWQLYVRLKRIHGVQSPGAFDYEAWALQKGLRATGQVVPQQQHQFIATAEQHYFIDQLRQHLQQQIHHYLPASATSPWLTALVIGERNNIPQAHWQILRSTGTNHLMAIAGLHIGFIAGFAHRILAFIWKRIPRLVLYFPASQAGACAALLTALFYSSLAGFSIPTQRACLMLIVFILTLLCRKKMDSWHSWSFAMLLVLIMNPLAVLTESFWLSFGTIALIVYGMSGRLAPSGWWWKWGRVQWVIGFGLIPFTLTLFQECSLISFVANSIAIPWLAFTILPCCFLSSIFLLIFPPVGEWLLFIADKSLIGLWIVL